jgi:hypothetical protein
MTSAGLTTQRGREATQEKSSRCNCSKDCPYQWTQTIIIVLTLCRGCIVLPRYNQAVSNQLDRIYSRSPSVWLRLSYFSESKSIFDNKAHHHQLSISELWNHPPMEAPDISGRQAMIETSIHDPPLLCQQAMSNPHTSHDRGQSPVICRTWTTAGLGAHGPCRRTTCITLSYDHHTHGAVSPH